MKWGSLLLVIIETVIAAPYYLEHDQLKEILATKEAKLLWHQWFWTVGLRKHPSFSNTKYPYNVTLHDLAPKMGKGIRIVFIDTGVAAFKEPGIPYHRDLSACAQFQQRENNLVERNKLPGIAFHHDKAAYLAGHGTHMMGIVGARLCLSGSTDSASYAGQVNGSITGFAPEATCIMIKAFHDDGTTTLELFIKALERAVELKPDILNLSLKIESCYINKQAKDSMEKLLSQIPYVVAAAGNNNEGDLCYPSCLQGVDFAISAFDYNHLTGACSVPEFCKKVTAQTNILEFHDQCMGAKNKRSLALPGVDVVSTGLAPGRMDGVYVVMDGTSCATACFTGFLALLLAEVAENYTKNAIIKFITENRVLLNDTIHTIDMRRILSKLKKYDKISY